MSMKEEVEIPPFFLKILWAHPLAYSLNCGVK